MMGIPNGSNPTVTPPRGAAAAGLIFSALMIATVAIIRVAVPANPAEPGIWLSDPAHRSAVRLALNFVPFTGIAFLWFIGVLRNRTRAVEDRFFATVLLSSGLLFVACVFVAAIAAGAIIETARPSATIQDEEIWSFARYVMYVSMNVFAIKMSGVFTFSTCTLALRAGIFPRWIALLGFACGIVLLLVISKWLWITLLFPLWITIVSAWILSTEWGQTG